MNVMMMMMMIKYTQGINSYLHVESNKTHLKFLWDNTGILNCLERSGKYDYHLKHR